MIVNNNNNDTNNKNNNNKVVIDEPKNLTKVTLRAAILLGIIGADENELLKSKHT